MTNADTRAPGLLRSLLQGALGFGAVGVAAYSIWAFGAGWFRGRGGEPAMYTAIAVVFLAGTGLLLHPLVAGPRRFIRFNITFLPAFGAYAAAWSAAWFSLGFGLGEWLGSFAGCLLFGLVVVLRHGRLRSLWKIVLVLFVVHSAAYFLGGELFYSMHAEKDPALSKTGMLLWGLIHGLGMGLGIGYAFHAAQAGKDR